MSDRLVDAVAVGRAWLAGGAHSDASWSVREFEGVLLRLESFDGSDTTVEVDEAEVRRLIERYGALEVVGPDLPPGTWDQVADATWSWTLWHDRSAGRWALQVVCGSVGIYEQVVVLDPPTVAAYQRHGTRLLEVLAAEVRST
jgi:hypothetical protein